MAAEYKLFVGNLPHDVDDKELHFVFKCYGKVKEIHVNSGDRLKSTGKNRSGDALAWVTYTDKEAAEDAIEVLDGQYRIREGLEKPMIVQWAKEKGDQNQKGWKKGSGKGQKSDGQAFASSQANWGGSRGNAAAASGSAGSHRDSWQDRGRDDRNGNPRSSRGSALFVGNLAVNVEEKALRYVFEKYGDVDQVHIISGKSRYGKSCAYIEYFTVDDAETAANSLNDGYEMHPGDGYMVVRFADRWRASPY
eukprot:TRINITY_DN11181_c0_g2_i1.p1 TRINITY_DN11181_c0_g2~~TRINITY_DN11181_c0_g2_i1.p1  ORF type:complete len:250 (+),score=41.03 TRINITY_DN11181_c0_g2_i1:96-845(+)